MQQIWNVRVLSVNTVNRKGKVKRTRIGTGKRPDQKRAVVTLAAGRHHRDLRSEGAVAHGRSQVQADHARAAAGASVSDFEEITRDTPEKSLTRRCKKARPQRARPDHHAPPRRRPQAPVPRDRLQRDKDGVPARSRPSSTTRTARRGSRCCTTPTARSATSWRPKGLEVGDRLLSGPGADIRPGNALPLANIPVGTSCTPSSCSPGRAQDGALGRRRHPAPGQGGRHAHAAHALAARSAWSTPACRATVGEVGNAEHELVSLGKAGRNRWRGKRPSVRGVAMNPVDHPLGGGEGKSSGGRHPTSPWGKKEGRARASRRRRTSSSCAAAGRRRG